MERPNIDEIKEVVISNTLQTVISSKVNQKLVFVCCGKPMRDIETPTSCPHCWEDNTQVMKLWKFNLVKAIAKMIEKDKNGK